MIIACVVCAIPVSAERVSLFANVNPGSTAAAPADFFVAGSIMLFSADDGVHGRELWLTDGLSYHTQLLKDINVSGASSPSHFTQLGGVTLFSADDGVHGRELWTTDGSAAHTAMVADINPGAAGSSPQGLTVFNGKVYFSADDGAHGRELWVTDGTSANTALVADIHPGAEGSNLGELTVLGSQLLFSADDGVAGQELWASDGAGSGTARVKDINPAGDSAPQGFVVFNGKAYFSANGGSLGAQLWVTDGSGGGTQALTALNGAGDFAAPRILGAFNGKLYLASRGVRSGAQVGVELWSTGGSSVALVHDINSGQGSSAPSGWAVLNGAPFFSASANGFNNELWTSDGISSATLVKEINPDTTGAAGSGSDPSNFTLFQDKLYFTAKRPAEGEELWVTDGTESGTTLVSDILPGPQGAAPRGFTEFGGRLYFSGQTGADRRIFVMDDGVNGLPTASNVAVAPPSPNDIEALTVSYTYSDPDSDAEGPTGILWFKNGARQFDLDGQKTVPSSTTHIGETWYSVIAPVDAKGGQGAPVQSNSVTILPILGDVDGNDHVDAVDIQLVINAALGLPTNVDADVNHDGKVDAVDVQLVINAALGLT